MLSSPVPSGGRRRIESGAVVANGEAQLGFVAVQHESDVDLVATVLERVLERLRETEVHGSLHLGIEAPGRADIDRRITREGGDGMSQGRCQATLRQRHRVDAPGQVAQLDAGAAKLIADLVEPGAEGRIESCGILTQRGELNLRRHEGLLGAVVEVSLDSAPLALGGCDDEP